MAQTIKVQDGFIAYSATDPGLALEFNVDGNMYVSTSLSVGADPLISGLITTPEGTEADLLITTGGAGILKLQQNDIGTLTLNNVQWPASEIQPGMYIGASSLNILEYATLELSALDDIELDEPDEGDVLTYINGVWTNSAPTSEGTPTGSVDETFVVQLSSAYEGDMHGYMFTEWNALVINTTDNASWDVNSNALDLNESGAWKVSVQVTAEPASNELWPQDATTYGTYVSSAVYKNEMSQYFRGAGSWGNLQRADQAARWYDEFIVSAEWTPFNVPIAVFAESYTAPSTPMKFTAMVTATKLHGTFIPPPVPG